MLLLLRISLSRNIRNSLLFFFSLACLLLSLDNSKTTPKRHKNKSPVDRAREKRVRLSIRLASRAPSVASFSFFFRESCEKKITGLFEKETTTTEKKTTSKMPMPTHINGLPVKTGAWEPLEDEMLCKLQGELGNR